MTPRVASAMRDHLANERTLLAWVRTGLSFMAFGIAVEKFSLFLHFSVLEFAPEGLSWDPMSARIMALMLIGFGATISVLGAHRTRKWARHAATLDGAPATWPLLSVAILSGALALLLIWHVLQPRI